MATANLDQLQRQTIAKIEALFTRLDTNNAKQAPTDTHLQHQHPSITTYTAGHDAFIAKLDKKEAPTTSTGRCW